MPASFVSIPKDQRRSRRIQLPLQRQWPAWFLHTIYTLRVHPYVCMKPENMKREQSMPLTHLHLIFVIIPLVSISRQSKFITKSQNRPSNCNSHLLRLNSQLKRFNIPIIYSLYQFSTPYQSIVVWYYHIWYSLRQSA